MEIGPVPGIRGIPAVTARRAEMQPPAVFDIDASAKPEEDGGQRSGRKAAGAEENEEDERMLDGELEAGDDAPETAGKGRVDYFA